MSAPPAAYTSGLESFMQGGTGGVGTGPTPTGVTGPSGPGSEGGGLMDTLMSSIDNHPGRWLAGAGLGALALDQIMPKEDLGDDEGKSDYEGEPSWSGTEQVDPGPLRRGGYQRQYFGRV